MGEGMTFARFLRLLSFFAALAVLLAALLLALLTATVVHFIDSAHAMDASGQYADSPFRVWYAQQYSAHGYCCNDGDASRYDEAYTINPDGSLTLEGTHARIHIEASKVLTGETKHWPDGSVTGGPNPTGHAVIWTADGAPPAADGNNVYCFSPGVLG